MNTAIVMSVLLTIFKNFRPVFLSICYKRWSGLFVGLASLILKIFTYISLFIVKIIILNSTLVTDCLQPFTVCTSVFPWYICLCHGNCYSMLTDCMLPPLLRPHCEELLTQSHPIAVQLLNAWINHHLHVLIPLTGTRCPLECLLHPGRKSSQESMKTPLGENW